MTGVTEVASMVDGTVTVGGQTRRGTRYAGHDVEVWFAPEPDSGVTTWRRAGAKTAGTFKADSDGVQS